MVWAGGPSLITSHEHGPRARNRFILYPFALILYIGGGSYLDGRPRITNTITVFCAFAFILYIGGGSCLSGVTLSTITCHEQRVLSLILLPLSFFKGRDPGTALCLLFRFSFDHPSLF